MKILCNLSFLLIALMSPALAYSKESCPNLTGSYGYIKANPVVVDLAKVFNFYLLRDDSGVIEIKGSSTDELSFFWKREKNMDAVSKFQLKFNKDYKCDKGSIVFKNKVKSFRNEYEGESLMKLSLAEPYSDLKIESRFKGRENISIFSYDSANVSFLKWWGAKVLTESIALGTAPSIDVKTAPESKDIEKPIIESKNIQKIREILNEKNFRSLYSGGLMDEGNNVLATLNARELSDIILFEERLRQSSFSYEIKKEPTWTSSGNTVGYYVEYLIKPN